MKCSDCVRAGLRSTVTLGAALRTEAYYPPFYDEDGAFHSHDGNRTSWTYRCSNGHTGMTTDERDPCPTCGKWWENDDA